MRQWSPILAGLMVVCVAAGGTPVELQPIPRDGDSAVYYDVDALGTLLRIDYANQRAQIMGRIDLEPEEAAAVSQGWTIDGDLSVMLLVNVPTTAHGWAARLWVCRADTGLCEKTSVCIDTTHAFEVCPTDGDAFVVSWGDTERQASYVFNPVTNSVRSPLYFELPEMFVCCSAPVAGDIRIFRPGDSEILVGNIETGKLKERLRLTDLLGQQPSSGRMLVEACLDDSLLVADLSAQEMDELTLLLVSATDGSLLARSERLPWLYGRFSIEMGADEGLRVFCIEERVARGHSEAAGTLREFRVNGGVIAPSKTTQYDPGTEILLFDEQRTARVLPRYEFAYRSIFSVWREVFSNALGGRYSPANVEAVVGEAAKIVKAYREATPVRGDRGSWVPLTTRQDPVAHQ